MMPQIYVYATDSYTEIAIKDFLAKMNPYVRWTVRSPSLPKPPKSAYSNKDILPKLSGRTGVGLEKFMFEELRLHPKNLEDCAAIVLEDDLDMQDANQDQGVFLASQYVRLNAELRTINEKTAAELICLYAAPEIETWFIEDWENSFGAKEYPLHHQIAAGLRKQIREEIAPICGGSLEQYSHHFSAKLSDSIQDMIHTLSIRFNVTDPKQASYSKRDDGSAFLSKIEPDKLQAVCRIYFAQAYRAIQSIR